MGMALNHTDSGDGYRGKDWGAGTAHIYGVHFTSHRINPTHWLQHICQVSEEHVLIPFSTHWDALYPWRGKEGAGNVN